jgi:fructan beta-fructosidase
MAPPGDIPSKGLVLRLDASDERSVERSGREVRVWRDTAGTGMAFAQEDAVARPRLRAISQGGPQALAFDGESRFLRGPAVLPEAHPSYAIIAVWRSRRDAGVQSVFEQAKAHAGGARAALLLEGPSYGFCGEGSDCLALAPVRPNAWHVTILCVDTAHGNAVRLNDNGRVFEGKTGNPLRLGDKGATIGRKFGAAREFFYGEIAEILVYARTLEADEESALQAALQKKWGIDPAAGDDVARQPAARRTLTVRKPYLHLPITLGAPKRVMRYTVGGKVAREFEIELADGDADYLLPSDVSAFAGRELVIELDHAPSVQVLDGIVESDVLPGAELLYKEPCRPLFHFSPRFGFQNDPNGLVYHRGEYHLFFQHNPYGLKWGNMHWGHAVSTDLVHWVELPITLYPPRLGDHPYSGSAVVDWKNTAGFQRGGEPPLVIVYPSTGRGTCLAYSNDRGRTFEQYAGNPVARKNGGDPKVFWHEASQCWVMVGCDRLTPVDPKSAADWMQRSRCGFVFSSSADLKTWERHSFLEDNWECPELFELPVDGDRAQKKWVLYANHTPSLIGKVRNVGGRYLIGSFDGKRFTPETDKLQFNCGNYYAAAQTYNEMPDGRRVNVAWAAGGALPVGVSFSQAMTFPVELTLRTTEVGPRLFAQPVREFEKLRTRSHDFSRISLGAETQRLPGLTGEAFDWESEFLVGPEVEEIGVTVRGVAITYKPREGRLSCDGWDAPLKPISGSIKLRLLVDRATVEIFANEGLVYMPMYVPPKTGICELAVYARGAGAAVGTMTLWELASIWK